MLFYKIDFVKWLIKNAAKICLRALAAQFIHSCIAIQTLILEQKDLDETKFSKVSWSQEPALL